MDQNQVFSYLPEGPESVQVVSPGHANLPIGGARDANREIGVPGPQPVRDAVGRMRNYPKPLRPDRKNKNDLVRSGLSRFWSVLCTMLEVDHLHEDH